MTHDDEQAWAQIEATIDAAEDEFQQQLQVAHPWSTATAAERLRTHRTAAAAGRVIATAVMEASGGSRELLERVVDRCSRLQTMLRVMESLVAADCRAGELGDDGDDQGNDGDDGDDQGNDGDDGDDQGNDGGR